MKGTGKKQKKSYFLSIWENNIFFKFPKPIDFAGKPKLPVVIPFRTICFSSRFEYVYAAINCLIFYDRHFGEKKSDFSDFFSPYPSCQNDFRHITGNRRKRTIRLKMPTTKVYLIFPKIIRSKIMSYDDVFFIQSKLHRNTLKIYRSIDQRTTNKRPNHIPKRKATENLRQYCRKNSMVLPKNIS